MKKLLLATAAFVGFIGTASATDLASRPPPLAAAVPPVALPFSWSSCYVGGFAGGAWVDNANLNNGYAQVLRLPYSAWDYSLDSSFIGGGTVGCNWQPIGTSWVFGIEGEVGYLNLRGSAFDSRFPLGPNVLLASTKIGDVYGMFTGRLGYAVDRLLFYAKGGAAFVDETVTISHPAFVGITPTYTATASNDKARWALGGGIEWAFANNWTLKGEYMAIGADDNSACAFNPGVGGPLSLPAGNYCWNRAGFGGINTVKIGLNYLFGSGLFGFGAPVVRRY